MWTQLLLVVAFLLPLTEQPAGVEIPAFLTDSKAHETEA